MNLKKAFSIFLAATLVSPMFAQQPFVQAPQAKGLWRPYLEPVLPPSILTNSPRLHALIHGGKLYLTLQDAIALAIENNMDLQVDRYGPLNADWTLKRQQGGGPLRGVTGGNSLTNQAVSGQGVAGALQSAGISSGGGGNGGGGGGGGTVSQIGPVTPNLDTFFQNSTFWIHRTVLEPFLFAGTTVLEQANHTYNSFAQQGMLTGGITQLTFNESYLKENSPGDVLNPSVAPVAQIYARQNLLNSFGIGVNSRFIRVAQKGISSAQETFRSQLLSLVSNVVNSYWDLVSSGDDLRAKQSALDFAQKFLDDTTKEIELGAVAKVDIYRAQAEVSTRKQDMAIAQQTLQQQETQLKDTLSRNGLGDALLESATIVTLDRITVPPSDDLPSLRELVNRAMAQRPDVQLSKINDESQEISAAGTANGVLPFLQVSGSTTNRAEAGALQPGAGTPAPNSVGGFGAAAAQILRHDYTSRAGTIAFQGSIGNHAAQADYGIDQLQLQQGNLVSRRNMNDIVVAISNQMVALRQARSRYRNAVATTALQQDLLDKEQQKFRLGSSTIDLIIAAQRLLSGAQSTEISALSQYSRAKVALDQVLGETLEVNHVSVQEALKGTVGYESKLPASALQP